MLKSELLAALQQEIRRHDFSTFVDTPPSVAQGGNGVGVLGCPNCMKRLTLTSEFLDHLANDVLSEASDCPQLTSHLWLAPISSGALC